MRQLVFAEWPSYPIVFLVPSLRADEIKREYLDANGIPTDDAKCIPLHFTAKKTPVAEMKRFVVEELVPHLKEDAGLKYLVVADAGYYRVLTGLEQTEANLGYVRSCLFGPWQVVYVPSFRTVFYDPQKVRAKIKQSLEALVSHIQGTYRDPGEDIVKFEAYPSTDEEIRVWLEKLLAMDCDLACDIEAFNLKHYKAGIGTISFAWSKHEGIAFPVDYVELQGPRRQANETMPWGIQVRNEARRALLRWFFQEFHRKLVCHNIAYDAYVLIFQLFMKDVLDTGGLLHGLQVLLSRWDCTRLITYLSVNSCAGNELGLKIQTQEFSGNYSLEVEDITTQPLWKLLRYNLIDSLNTLYLREKYWPKLVADRQLEIYETLFKPATLDIVQMQLTGLPIDMRRVGRVKRLLQAILDDASRRMGSTRTMQQFTYTLQEKHVRKRNSELKKKRISMTDQETLDVRFNPNSYQQKQELLYEQLGFPVIALTDSKQPAVDADTLEKLLVRSKDPDVREMLQALIDYTAVDKLLGTFIPAFEDAMLGPDGWHYLVGAFLLGGAVSGRLSSRNPNLQNLPANVEMLISAVLLAALPELLPFVKDGKLHLGKLIKSCFKAPAGWIYCGLDFNSLEDRISALTTKDPNKLKVYIDGYDGHSLRAFAYFGDQMPDIVDTVESINSIQKKYKSLRQDSKAPTFALTYQGTWMTLVANCGFSEGEAKAIAARYHILYAVSDAWVQEKLDRASKDGFITAAFGLRIRTPLLAQVVRGSSKTPHEADAEGRTAGNALGQSWCLLNERAGAEFMEQVRAGEHRLDIRPCAHIHDAQYYLVRDDADTLLYLNERLVKAVKWQEHPDIRHPDVHLGGTLSVFWPDWSVDIEIPNGVDEAGLTAALEARLERA